jgi:hypothetical protein
MMNRAEERRKMVLRTTEGNGGGALLRRVVLLLAATTLVAAMLAASALPALARTPFDPEPRDCANGVAQTFGSDPDHNAADALEAFCNLPIKKEVGKGR